MKRMLLILGLAVMALAAYAQTFTADHFEVYTKMAHSKPSPGFTMNRDSIMARINNLPDTTDQYATFMVALSNSSDVDSISFTLTNSQSQTAYSGSFSYSALQSNPSFRIAGNNLYYTVGPLPYLKHFAATVAVTSGGNTITKTFAKN